MSSIDFTPAQTTATDVLASSCRSAEMSIVVWAPRCTPPMPPVAKTFMPAIWAKIIVDATVVAPSFFCPTMNAMSLLLVLMTACAAFPRYSICSRLRPITSLPCKIAIVAGTAPLSRIIFSTFNAVSTFFG